MEPDGLRQRPARHHGHSRRAAGELRRQREKQLVDEPLREKRGVQPRPPLAEHRADTVVGAQPAQEGRELARPGRLAKVLELRGHGAEVTLHPGEDEDLRVGVLQQRYLGREAQMPAHHAGDRIGRQALHPATLATGLVAHETPIALDRRRVRSDHHRVGLGAQAVEDRPVLVASERLGAAGDRRGAVGGGDHVEDEIGAVGGRLVAQPQPAGGLVGGRLAGVGVDPLQRHGGMIAVSAAARAEAALAYRSEPPPSTLAQQPMIVGPERRLLAMNEPFGRSSTA